MPEKHEHKTSVDSVAIVSYPNLTQKKLDWIMMRKWLNQLRNDLMANLTANRGTGVRRALAHAPLGLNNELKKLSMVWCVKGWNTDACAASFLAFSSLADAASSAASAIAISLAMLMVSAVCRQSELRRELYTSSPHGQSGGVGQGTRGVKK